MEKKIASTRTANIGNKEPNKIQKEKNNLKYSVPKISSNNEAASKLRNAIENKNRNKTKSINLIENVSILVGKTLKQNIANEYLGFFKFNHLGKITGINENSSKLTEDDLQKIRANIIPDLTRTNSSAPREHSRTNREIVLEFIHLTTKELNALPLGRANKSEILKAVIDSFTTLWLSPCIGSDLTKKVLIEVAKNLKRNFPDLGKKASTLAAEAAKPKSFTQMHDNTFGRKFESELVRALVNNPPKSVLHASDKVADYLKSHFINSEGASGLSAKLDLLARAISSDRRPWHSELPELEAFVKNPSKENFIAMMENKQRTGFEVMKVSYIGVRISVLNASPWMERANANYQQAILPARSTRDSVLASFDNRVPLIASKFMVKAARANAFSKAGLRPIQFKKNLLEQLNKNPTNKNAKAVFDEIRKTYEKTSPELSDIAGEIYEFLKNKDPKSSIDLISVSLSPEEKYQLEKQKIRPTVVKSNNFGTFLPHQPIENLKDGWSREKNFPAGLHVNIHSPTEYEKNTLLNEQNTVNGASGSTNILTFLYKYMQENAPKNGEPALNIHDAFAGAMMFLTFDGGHSLPESISTFTSIINDKKIDEDSDVANNLSKFSLDYLKIPGFFTSKDIIEATEKAMNAAFAETLKLFSKVHEERTASPSIQRGN